MRLFTAASLLLVCTTAALAADEGIFAPGAKLKVEADNGSGGEGPAWHPELGVLTSGFGPGGNHIHVLDRKGQSKIYRKDGGTNGLLFDAKGRLLACEPFQRRITRTELDGKITVLGPSVDPNTRRVFVRSEIEDPQHLLRAGMFADFTIRIDDAVNAIAVPAAAVVREGDGSLSAWTTKDDRHFLRRTVKVGHIQEGFDQILEGLQRGERVVTEGAVFLSNKLAGGASD